MSNATASKVLLVTNTMYLSPIDFGSCCFGGGHFKAYERKASIMVRFLSNIRVIYHLFAEGNTLMADGPIKKETKRLSPSVILNVSYIYFVCVGICFIMACNVKYKLAVTPIRRNTFVLQAILSKQKLSSFSHRQSEYISFTLHLGTLHTAPITLQGSRLITIQPAPRQHSDQHLLK